MILLLIVQVGTTAANTDGLCLVTVTDANNEKLSGASIEIVGSAKVYYTNINGFCYIPKSVLNGASKITINCISYKTAQVNPEDLHSKIILKSR